MNIGLKKDAGRQRTCNEDWCLVNREIGLFLVADGVGGRQAGEVASRLAAETIENVLMGQPWGSGSTDIPQSIHDAFDSAHAALRAYASSKQDLDGMGTTVVLGIFREGTVYIGHIGDSRAYRVTETGIEPLTEDHSVVARLVREEKITEEEAKTHSMRHVITQCLGCDGYEGPDIREKPLENGDIVLLCSDGLTDMIDDDNIRDIVNATRYDLQESAEALVDLANENGGRDNITVILFEYRTGAGGSGGETV